MDILTTAQAAAILGVHKNSAKRSMITRGLEPVRLGKAWMWKRADVERLAEDALLTNVPPAGSNREFTKAATFNVATNPPTPAEVKRRLVARNRRRTGADGVRARSYQAMVEKHVTDEISPVSVCVVCRLMVRAEARYRGQA